MAPGRWSLGPCSHVVLHMVCGWPWTDGLPVTTSYHVTALPNSQCVRALLLDVKALGIARPLVPSRAEVAEACTLLGGPMAGVPVRYLSVDWSDYGRPAMSRFPD
jgi:hypothetical protein